MDLTERIERRRDRNQQDGTLLVDPDELNPAIHLPEPVGRETLFEALLDALDPLFTHAVPPNAYVWGPQGSGKSAIVTALVSALETKLTGQQHVYTATRGESSRPDRKFVYLDARRATSRFQFYRRLLASLGADDVPERGVSTETLRNRIGDAVAASETVLVAVDHVEESKTLALGEVYDLLDPFEGLAWLGVGRTPPEELPFPLPEQRIHVPAYAHELLDILTVRASRGLSQTLDHTHARRLADWAEGDAHDALAATYLAAVNAEADGATRLRNEDVEAGMRAVPTGGVAIGRVLSLSDNEQLVLERLFALSLGGETIDAAADRIAADTDLTAGTVRRLLYELAQFDVLERQTASVGGGTDGRQPSTVTPNFSGRLFQQLRDP